MTESSTRSVVFEREMPHPPERIWRALTEGPLIAQWLYENDFQPVVGHPFNFRGKARPHWNGVIDGRVLIVEPNEQLSYDWNASGGEAAEGLKTVVAWTLTPGNGSTTQVRMEQSGFRSEDEAKGPSYGWERLFTNLERVVAGLT
jgi:uncharacterized protein YndB with AHSA1/START domain